MAEAVFRHELSYPDNHGITLSDIAATLVAHERLIPLVAEILERSIPGLSVEKTSIKLDYARTGSLSEAFFVAILVVYQKQLDENVPKVIEKLTGIQIPDDLKSLVSVLLIILLYFGAKALFQRKGKKDMAEAPPRIEGDYNTYINIAAEKLDLPREALEAAVERTVTPKRRNGVTRSSIDLFRPAKRGGNGRIVPTGAPEISSETVAEFPNEVMLAELEEDTEIERFDDVLLEVRATDRDAADRGWAGRLISGAMKTKRLSLRLYPTVDRETLANRAAARVEAIIESRRLDDDTTKPIRIHVLRLLD